MYQIFCRSEFSTVSSEWIFYIFYVLNFSVIFFMHICSAFMLS
jgi:hypothetical protein